MERRNSYLENQTMVKAQALVFRNWKEANFAKQLKILADRDDALFWKEVPTWEEDMCDFILGHATIRTQKSKETIKIIYRKKGMK